MKSFAFGATLLFSFLPLGPCYAWGADGHRLVAELAEAQLTPEVRAEVNRLLAGVPGATLASVSTWADEVRSPTTAAWHYVNPRAGDCSYVRARDCPDGRCSIEAVNRQFEVLRSSRSDDERVKALKWVVHLVADLHQPLHAGFRSDKGGNSVQLQAFGRGTNLHAVWDGGLLRHRREGFEELMQRAKASGPARRESLDAAAWASESCRIVVSPGFYPEKRTVGLEYAQQWDATLLERLGSAGHRLAAALNSALR